MMQIETNELKNKVVKTQGPYKYLTLIFKLQRGICNLGQPHRLILHLSL